MTKNDTGYRQRGPRGQASSVLVALLASSMLAACGDEAASEDESDAPDLLLFSCGEARGALYEVAQMLSGNRAFSTSTLDYGVGSLRRLADEVSASAEVRRDLDAWHAARNAWSDARTAIPPTIVDGRLIEPDTTGIDQAALRAVRPIAERLEAWHTAVCGEP